MRFFSDVWNKRELFWDVSRFFGMRSNLLIHRYCKLDIITVSTVLLYHEILSLLSIFVVQLLLLFI